MTEFTTRETSKLLQANAKRRYPAIPDPAPDLKSLFASVQALKEAVELLTRQRAATHPSVASAVTWADLLELELIEQEQVPTNDSI